MSVLLRRTGHEADDVGANGEAAIDVQARCPQLADTRTAVVSA